MQTIIVIGGGAAGLMAALSAAEHPDRRILLLERQQRVGRKLLSTGNGRCNLSNRHASAAYYYGADADFVTPALRAFGPEETLSFFRSLGLLTRTEPDGKVYPYSNQAGSVLDVLRFALEARGSIRLYPGCTALGAERCGSGFSVETNEGVLKGDRLIVAAGAPRARPRRDGRRIPPAYRLRPHLYLPFPRPGTAENGQCLPPRPEGD
jgi:predicted Rossmann fold flavoprotein